MERQDRIRQVRTSRILRVRDYGFEKLITKYSKDIYNASYSYEELEDEIKRTYNSMVYRREAFADFFQGLNDRLTNFIKKLPEVLNKALLMGHSKITDTKGQKLTLAVPNYTQALRELTNDNLKYVKDLSDDSRKKMIDLLKDSIKKGDTYKVAATKIHESIKDITLTRSKLIASTEINRAINLGMNETLKQNQIEFYIYLTAGDQRVSDVCKINSYGNKAGRGGRIKWRVGRGPLPVVNSHPRCRCIICAAPK